VLAGPGYLLWLSLAGWQISDLTALVAIVAFVAGFATLVVRMSDRPRDDDDDGASSDRRPGQGAAAALPSPGKVGRADQAGVGASWAILISASGR